MLSHEGVARIAWPKQCETKLLPGARAGSPIGEIGLGIDRIEVNARKVRGAWSVQKFMIKLKDRPYLPRFSDTATIREN
jgi:hypothetical protein